MREFRRGCAYWTLVAGWATWRCWSPNSWVLRVGLSPSISTKLPSRPPRGVRQPADSTMPDFIARISWLHGRRSPSMQSSGRLVLSFSGQIGRGHLPIGRTVVHPGGIMALQEPSWKIWLAYTSHLPLRSAVTILLRDTFLAGGANTEMELPLYRGFTAANLTEPQLRLELPIGGLPGIPRHAV